MSGVEVGVDEVDEVKIVVVELVVVEDSSVEVTTKTSGVLVGLSFTTGANAGAGTASVCAFETAGLPCAPPPPRA